MLSFLTRYMLKRALAAGIVVVGLIGGGGVAGAEPVGDGPTPYVVGGEPEPEGSLPFVASVLYGSWHGCTGSLIAEE